VRGVAVGPGDQRVEAVRLDRRAVGAQVDVDEDVGQLICSAQGQRCLVHRLHRALYFHQQRNSSPTGRCLIPHPKMSCLALDIA